MENKSKTSVKHPETKSNQKHIQKRNGTYTYSPKNQNPGKPKEKVKQR